MLTPSFFSYVVPLRRATLAVFRNSLQNYRERYEIGDRFVPAINGTEDGTFGNIAASVESYGFGGAYVLSRYISVGGSAMLESLDLASEARSGTPLNPRNGTNTIDSDLEWSGLVGVLVKPTPSLALGFTYNKGSIFEVKTRLFGNFLFTLPGNPPRRIDVNFTGDERDINYVLPDRYSAGMSWRPSNSLTVLWDVSRVNYSQQITEKFLIADFLDPDARVSPANFFINDVYEDARGPRVAPLWARRTFAVRGGAFTDPDHRLRFRSGGNNPEHPADYLLNFRFNTGRSRTDVGVTAGAGVTLLNRVQIDAATSFSPDATDVVVSMVVRLP